MPKPNITFYKNEERVERKLFKEYQLWEKKDEHGPRMYSGCLEITTVSHYDNGNYTMVAENFLGKDVEWEICSFIENPGW